MITGRDYFKKLPSLTLMCCAIAAANSTIAAEKSNWALEEIIVTAQKKMASVNDVPVSITAVDAGDIRELRITESTDIAAYVPNVDIKGTLAGGNPAITLRGVGLNDFNANNNPSVGVYVDEVFMASPGLLTFSTFDIERIEVLKGPQGTLYGRNTNGGAINFFTTRPNGEQGGYINATAGNFEVLEVEAAYGDAISELWSYRVSTMIQTQGENYGENKYPGGDDFGDTERYAIRTQFGYESDDLIANIALTYGSENLGFTPFKTRGALDAATLTVPCSDISNQALCANVAGEQYLDQDEDRYYYSPNIPQNDSEADTLITVLNLEKILDEDRSFYSITSFSDVDREYTDAIYESPQFGLRYFDGIHDEDISQFSQEFRLTTSAEQYDWNVGIFLSTDDVDSSTLFSSDAALTQIDVTYEQTTDALAAFSHVDYAVNDDFSVELGVRYSWEERDYKGGTTDLDPLGLSPFVPSPGSGPYSLTAHTDYKFDDENVSGKLGANYHPTDDLMLYGSISTGFKSGIVFADLTFDPIEEGPLEPEEIISFEVGAKSTWLDNTLQVNASLFQYDYKDIQTLVLGTISLMFVNADEAKVKGGEVEFTWRPLEGLDIRGGVGFLDTEITDDIQIVAGNAVNLDGNELPNAPDLQYLAVVRYTFLLDGGMELLLQGDFKYSDDMYKDANNIETIKSDDYTIYNARVALSMPDAGWEVSVWGKNVTDERYQEHIFNGIFFGATNELYNPPATYGVSVNYEF